MANKITTVLEFVGADGASKQIKRLSQDFQKAEGASAKFKVASTGFKDVLKQNVAQAAAVAGTALVAFGVKSVQAFQETALEAGKFADATGLAVDDASRWIEVAGDVGVSAETMEGAFLRLNKAIGDGAPVLEEYGIQTQNASSHCLRKTFARRVYEANGRTEDGLILLSQILNHTGPAMTRKYIGLTREVVAEAYMNL